MTSVRASNIERGEVDVGTIIVRRLASHSKVRDASQVQGAPTRSPGPGNDVQRDDFLFMTVVIIEGEIAFVPQ